MNLDLFANTEHDSPFPFSLPQSPEYSAVQCDRINGYVITVPQGQLLYIPLFLTEKLCARSVEYFLENATDLLNPNHMSEVNPKHYAWLNIPWRQDLIEVYGTRHVTPRWSSWHGDDSAAYAYSNMTMQPNPWNKGLLYLKQKVEQVSECAFNSVLLNCYRNGADSVGWHADDEYELGVNPVVASLSLGESRRFLLRNNANHHEKIDFTLSNGDLLIMGAGLQSHYQHSVPKALKVTRSRINLTFRYIHSA
jgi:alkylated DNA repair dioxygenase AlkB